MTANEALIKALGWEWQAAVGVPTATEAVEEVIRDLDGLGWVVVSKADVDALGVFRAEEARQVRWNAFCELSDLRCLDCNLRYGERQDYSCPPGYPEQRGDHSYDRDDVARLTKEAGHDK